MARDVLEASLPAGVRALTPGDALQDQAPARSLGDHGSVSVHYVPSLECTCSRAA